MKTRKHTRAAICCFLALVQAALSSEPPRGPEPTGRSAAQFRRAPSSTCVDSHPLFVKIVDPQPEQAEQVASALADELTRLPPVCAGLLLSKLAATLQISGRPKEAEAFAVRAITYFEKKLPPDDPVYLDPLQVLAGVRFEQGMIGKAREAFRRMQAVRAETPHARVLVHGMSAALLHVERRWKEAESEYEQTLAALTDAGKENTGDTAAVLNELAALYVEEHREQEALMTAERAMLVLNRARDAVPLDRIKVLTVRGVIRARQGQWREAEKDLCQAVFLARHESQVDPIEFGPLAANYAAVLRKVHRKREAQSMEAWGAALRGRNPTSNRIVDITELASKPHRKKQ